MSDANPLVRVELEFEDGRTQRLVGPAAQEWLDEINSVMTLDQLRGGRPRLTRHKWETGPYLSDITSRFEGYEGTD